MPLPLTVSCFSKIQIGFTFLVPTHPGSPGQRAVKRVCVFAAVQVARALDYLASAGLVHRDVAARNVVVGARVSPTPPAKLSDFGLSRYPHADDYCRPPAPPHDDRAAPVPLRWLAPEALFAGRYSEASDAWSYGVLLWEMYCGRATARPYEELSDRRLIDAMRGRREARPVLPPTADCPPSVYALMAECWKKDASVRRPRFGTVLDRLLGGRRRDPDSSPAGGSSDGTGVAVLASAAAAASDSPRLGGTSSFPEPPGGRAARPRRRSGGPFSPAAGR